MAESARFVVAVVDDDDRTLESLADLLEAAGYDVRLYTSAKAVWTRGGLSDIDCLISDIGMPEMDGFELRRLALSERPELPVILVTGRPELRTQDSSNIEPDRYFEKPFDGRQLLAAVRAALGSARPKGDA
jgi:DNA-binding response OmpR family regulator